MRPPSNKVEALAHPLAEPPFVSIIVLNYNSEKFLGLFDDCVRSVLDTDYPAFEVLLIDNGSTDNCGQSVFDKYCKFYLNLKLIKLPSNLGYSGGNNYGSQCISQKAELIAFLNSDVLVAKDWLLPLVKGISSDTKAGAVGPSGTFVTLGVMPCPLKRELESPYYANHILGHCLLVRRSVFNLVHGFNSSYFMYWDEVDFCERIRAVGYESLVIPSTKVRHLASSSFGANKMMVQRSFWLSRNMFYLVYQNYVASRVPLAVAVIFLNRTKRAISLGLRSKDPFNMIAVIRGTMAGFLFMKNASRVGHRRGPFKDPTLLPPVVDLLYILLPPKLVESVVQTIILRNVRRASLGLPS